MLPIEILRSLILDVVPEHADLEHADLGVGPAEIESK